MPVDTNQYGDIFGGWLLGQMDIAGEFSRLALQREEQQPLLLTQ
jgi:acyl-CoA hydrolase